MLQVFKSAGLFGIYWYIYIFDQVHGYFWLGYLAILWLIVWLFILVYITHILFFKFTGLVIFSSIFLIQYSWGTLVYLTTFMEGAFLAHKLLLIHIWLTINLALANLAQSGEISRRSEVQLKFMFSWFLFFIGGAWWLMLFLGEKFWWKTTDSVEFLLLVLFIFFFYIFHIRKSYNESYRRYIGFFIGIILCILCYKEVDPSSPFHSSFKFYIVGGFSYFVWFYFLLNFFVLDCLRFYGYVRFKDLQCRYLYIFSFLHLAVYWVVGVIIWVGFWYYMTILSLILVYKQVHLYTLGIYISFVVYNFLSLSFLLVITLLLLIECFNFSIVILHYIMLYSISVSLWCIKAYKLECSYLSWVYYCFLLGILLFQLVSKVADRHYGIKW